MAIEDSTSYTPSAYEKKDDTDSDDPSISRIENASDERPVVDPATEKALMRKLDIRLIPMVMWMYLMSFMDRVSIGNARYVVMAVHAINFDKVLIINPEDSMAWRATSD